MRVFKTPRYIDEKELLDDLVEVDRHDLRTTLRDIRRANIFGLGTWVVKHHLERVLAAAPPGPVKVLDVGTGSGDIPEELCRWSAAVGREMTFVLADISPQVLGVARTRLTAAGFDGRADFAACSASALPFEDGAFDAVICSLTFHHLALDQAQAAVKEMSRVARHGFVINDIYRSRGAWLMAWFLVHSTTTNRLTRHDGPASVLRAFTPAEIKRIAASVGVPVKVYRHPFWRVAAVSTNGQDR